MSRAAAARPRRTAAQKTRTPAPRPRSRRAGARRGRRGAGNCIAHFHNLSWVYIAMGVMCLLVPIGFSIAVGAALAKAGAGSSIGAMAVGGVMLFVALPFAAGYIAIGVCLGRFHAWARIAAIVLGGLGLAGGLINLVRLIPLMQVGGAVFAAALLVTLIAIGANLYALVTLVPRRAELQYRQQRELLLDRQYARRAA